MKYSELVKVYQALEGTTKRLEKTAILAELLKKAKVEELDEILYLVQGKVFPAWDERKLGMSFRLMLKAINIATGVSGTDVEKLWKKTGDLGKVAEELVGKKKQRTLVEKKLDVEKVFENIRKLPELEGAGTVAKKVSLVAELLTSASPVEARFIVRTVLEKLRVGIAEGVLRDAIAKAFEVDVSLVEHGFSSLMDYAEVAKLAKKGEKELGEVKISIGKPIRAMLAIRVESLEEGFKAVGKPAQIEYKLDGFRVQIHKQGNKFWLFTRRLENVTNQFKEILPLLKKNVKGNSYILDSELVGYDPKTSKYLPFQNISQRIKRKYDIEKMAKELPVEVNLFDVINYNGKSLIEKPFKERRKLLEKIIKEQKNKIVLVKQLVTEDVKKAEAFYKEALKTGNEGVMIKNLNATYIPGRRVAGWVKLKPVMETLDLVVTGAIWGEGKRANWLSSFILACRKDEKFLGVGKVGTGIKEKKEGVTFEELTKLLKPLIESEKGKTVKIKPKIVVEVGYEEIQKSPTYSSGYALRFPKLIKIRFDRGANECSTLKDVERLYKGQKK